MSIRRKEKKELYWEERVINGYRILIHESLASNHFKIILRSYLVS